MRERPLIAGLLIAAIVIAGAAVLTGKVGWLKWKSDKSLALTSATPRGELSRNLVRTAWRRMHWARVYVYRVSVEAPPADLETSWLKYNDATSDWNSDLMINIKGLAEYYPGTGKREQFELEIQNLWRGISNQLFNLRYRTPKEAPAKKQLIEDVLARIDILNNVLYEFTLSESSPKDK